MVIKDDAVIVHMAGADAGGNPRNASPRESMAENSEASRPMQGVELAAAAMANGESDVDGSSDTLAYSDGVLISNQDSRESRACSNEGSQDIQVDQPSLGSNTVESTNPAGPGDEDASKTNPRRNVFKPFGSPAVAAGSVTADGATGHKLAFQKQKSADISHRHPRFCAHSEWFTAPNTS